MNRIGVKMHGVKLNLSCNQSNLLEYAKDHLDELVTGSFDMPDLQVHCRWTQGEWDATSNPFPANGEMSIIGKRMLGADDDLIWLNTIRMKGLQLRFRRSQEQYLFDVDYRFSLKKEKLESKPDYEYKRYFSLMSYLVYYPIMWYLERHRSWTVLHASALVSGKEGIVIGGLGGVGKTTTCVALMQQEGIELLSENIIFTDGESIFACQEPIRLNQDSLAMLGDSAGEMRAMPFPEGLKDKTLYHLTIDQSGRSIRPAVFFLPKFSSSRYCQELPHDIAAEKMVAMNRLTRELDDYYWYAAALDMTWPRAGIAAMRANLIHRFAAGCRCFELGIDRQAGVSAVVDDIMRTLD